MFVETVGSAHRRSLVNGEQNDTYTENSSKFCVKLEAVDSWTHFVPYIRLFSF